MNFRASDTIVAVIGDHCLDKDYCGDFGNVMSREQGDMPIFDSANAHYSGGGAANIVDLLQNWGVRVLPCGVWNPLHDVNSKILLDRWQTGFVDTQFMVEGYGTPAYVKYYKEDGEHVFRANEVAQEFEPDIQEDFHHQVFLLSKEPIDIVIVADYNEDGRGILTDSMLQDADSLFQCPTVGLSRQRIKELKGYDYLILNEEELINSTRRDIDNNDFDNDEDYDAYMLEYHDIWWRQIQLCTKTKAQNLLLTLKGRGAELYNWVASDSHYTDQHEGEFEMTGNAIDSQSQEGQINVCGCGDTFTAAFTICLASGMTEVEAIRRANAAARVQTRKLYGARTVDLDEWEVEYQLLYSEVSSQLPRMNAGACK